MDQEEISEEKKYLVTFDTKLLIQAKNHDEVVEKLKSELIRLLDEPVPMDTNLSIHPVETTRVGDQESSYMDDWEFDDNW